jgi:hypothetical protein
VRVGCPFDELEHAEELGRSRTQSFIFSAVMSGSGPNYYLLPGFHDVSVMARFVDRYTPNTCDEAETEEMLSWFEASCPGITAAVRSQR